MSKLIFNASEVRRVVEHSLAAREQMPVAVDYDQKTGIKYEPAKAPAVLLVHDDGIYLMSNGKPRDLLNANDKDEIGSRSYVAYARGCDPRKDGDWYDRAEHLVGGDDFGETLPWACQIKRLIDGGASEIVIYFGAKRLALSARFPKAKAVRS